MVILIWILTIYGTLYLLYSNEIVRYFAPLLSIIIGVIGVIFILTFISTYDSIQITTFWIGVLCFSVGGVIYAIQKPDISDYIGFHEIYHTIITIGVIFFLLFIDSM